MNPIVWACLTLVTADPTPTAPDWRDLPGVDGKLHSLKDITDPVLVLAITCNSCPYAVAYEDRFIAFAKEYASRQVRFVAINVNREPEDNLPAMIERAKAKGITYPYLFNASQKIGQTLGAKVTPTIFVFDQQRRLVYRGGFDDAKKPENVTRQHLRLAVDELLAGKPISQPTTTAAGCRIRYDD